MTRPDQPAVEDVAIGDVGVAMVAARNGSGRWRRRWIWLVLILVSVGCLAAGDGLAGSATGFPYSPPAPTSPGPLAVNNGAWSGNGMLAFVSRGRLYVLSSSGSLSQVSGPPSGGFDSNPAWSARGGVLAFLHTGQAQGWDVPPPTLWVLAAGATRATRVPARAVGSFHWSPRGNVLAYIAGVGSGGTGSLWRQSFAPSTGPQKLLANVWSLLWSPSGGSIAANVSAHQRSTVEVIPATGGAPIRWYSTRDACITLASWSPTGERIAAWVDPGCDDNADGMPLYIISPHLARRKIAMTLIDMFSLSWSPDGQTLAVVSPGGRSVWWENKDVEVCSMTPFSCRRLPKPPGTVALEPAWSASGTLYYLTASDSGPFANEGHAYWSPGWIAEWEATSTAWELAPGAAAPSELPAATGHVLAFVPSSTSSTMLLVRDDALWLLRDDASTPVRIAGPLLNSAAPSGYYGELDWTALFAWSAAPGPSEVASQASAALPDQLETIPNPPNSQARDGS